MARNTVFQIREIGRHIELAVGEGTRKTVMEGSEAITDSSKSELVAEWVAGAMDRLDMLVEPETRNRIMTECGHNCALANPGPIDRAKGRRKKYKTEEAFLQAEVQSPPPGTRLVADGSTLYQFYTPRSYTRPMRCYCSLLRGLPEGTTASLTYCQCSRGFVEKYWESVLGRPVDVDLVESSISGAAECTFAVRL